MATDILTHCIFNCYGNAYIEWTVVGILPLGGIGDFRHRNSKKCENKTHAHTQNTHTHVSSNEFFKQWLKTGFDWHGFRCIGGEQIVTVWYVYADLLNLIKSKYVAIHIWSEMQIE